MHGGELLSINHTPRVRPKFHQFQWLGHQHNLFHIHSDDSRLPESKMLQIAAYVYQAETSQEKLKGKLCLP
jgi:hypothetical protein